MTDPHPRRYYIFLAEDNRADVYLIRRALKDAGVDFDLTVAEDGAQALQFVREVPKKPDLILLDLNLPKADGGTVLLAIRENQRLLGVPVVILTSSPAPRDRSKALQLHVSDYLIKPLDLSGFLAIGRKLRGLLENANDETPSATSCS